MAFNPNIPQASDKLSQSQVDILANFQAIAPLFDQGILEVVDLPVQAVMPTPATPGDILLYNFLNPTTTKNEGYVHKYAGAGSAEIPFTASTLSTNATPGPFSNGYTLLPSGIQLRWGQGSGTGGVTVTLSGGIPFNGIIMVLVCPVNSASGDQDFAVRVKTILSTTQFSVFVSNRTTTGSATGNFNYLVIGY